jgi:hypothetical protein
VSLLSPEGTYSFRRSLRRSMSSCLPAPSRPIRSNAGCRRETRSPSARWLDDIGSNGCSGWSSLGSSRSRCWGSSRCWAGADASGSLRFSPLEEAGVTELRLSVPEAALSPHNFAISARPRPVFSQVSTPFGLFWLAAKRSGVRIPLVHVRGSEAVSTHRRHRQTHARRLGGSSPTRCTTATTAGRSPGNQAGAQRAGRWGP